MAVAINEAKYTIEPSDFRCASCQAEIAVETSFFSAIFFEEESFRRRSFCLECWKNPPPSAEGAYAIWRSRRPAPQVAQKKLQFDPGLILEFFRRLGKEAMEESGTQDSPKTEPGGEKVRLRLVLALLLIRRKVLIFESSALRDGREWLKLSEKADPNQLHYVENPPLSDGQLEAVKVSLGELLQMDL